MAEDNQVIEAVARLVTRYHETRDRDGIDAATTEWIRAEISGARWLLEAFYDDAGRGRILAGVRKRTGKGIPHRDREWMGWDSEAQRER